MSSASGGSQSSAEEAGRSPDGDAEERRAALDQALIEVRQLLADLENPFTLVGKLVNILGRDKAIEAINGTSEEDDADQPRHNGNGRDALAPFTPILSPRSDHSDPSAAASEQRNASRTPNGQDARESDKKSSGEDGAQPPSRNPPPASIEDAPLPVDDRSATAPEAVGSPSAGSSQNTDYYRHVNSLELASLLADLFGKERSIEALGSYVSRNWIKEDVAKVVLDASTLIQKDHFEGATGEALQMRVEEHRLALYLLDEFARSIFSYALSVRFAELMTVVKSAFYLSEPQDLSQRRDDMR